MARALISHDRATDVLPRSTRSSLRIPRTIFSAFSASSAVHGFRSSRSWLVASLGIMACAAAALDAQSLDVQRVLQQIKTADTGQLSVSEEDGRFLRVMAAASGAKRILEIGGAFGYSAIWMGLGLRETGGRLTSIEFDPARAKIAAAHVRAAGLADIVTVVAGDAFKEIPKLDGTFDFVFVDAWKRDYKAFLDLMLPRLNPRGLFLAHNVVNKENEMRDFLAAIKNDPRLMTTIVAPSGEGISVSYKRP
jgi:caffeoyl-CoA O-methyltransferase